MKKIYFTVTNDLSYDQRMQRICHSLADNGYAITLVGVKKRGSLPLVRKKYEQHRINCIFSSGKLFYAEYNLRLFFYLLFKKMDAVCAIDLDTILPCLWVSGIKKIPRVYDAHELFTGLKEVVSRRFVKNIWTGIERYAVPKFKNGYTVCDSIASEFNSRYKVHYQTIRNVPVLKALDAGTGKQEFLLYQGAVNEGRGFEYLVPAMQWIRCKLVICGDGNFMGQLKKLISDYKMESKIELKGMITPEQLWEIAQTAKIGIATPENNGLNQYLALPNKFFDYIHAGLPQVNADYPEYRKINDASEVAVLLDDLTPEKIAEAVNHLLENKSLYQALKNNCLKARLEYHWGEEENKLLAFYKNLFTN